MARPRSVLRAFFPYHHHPRRLASSACATTVLLSGIALGIGHRTTSFVVIYMNWTSDKDGFGVPSVVVVADRCVHVYMRAYIHSFDFLSYQTGALSA